MYLNICVLCVIFGSAFCAERDTPCVTPNGENGTCIPVNSCRPIKQAIAYFDEAAIDFARKSQCGHDDGPLVCCGSVGKVTGPPSSTQRPTVPPIQKHDPLDAIPIDHVLLPDRSLCGLQVPENKGLREMTEVAEFPWMAALKYTNFDGTPPDHFRCSGTLINERYVLTAARCLNLPGYNLIEVRLGEWKFSAPKLCIPNPYNEGECEHSVIDLKIEERIPHPYYNNHSGNYDIAILRLERLVKFNEFVRPICLPPSEHLTPPPGTRMETSGWALTKTGKQSDVKLKGKVVMVGPTACNKTFPNYIQTKLNHQACVETVEPKWCNGDSGSPIMRLYKKEDEDDQEQWFQEGIIYKGLGCEPNGGRALYTRVSRYINWILSHLKQ